MLGGINSTPQQLDPTACNNVFFVPNFVDNSHLSRRPRDVVEHAGSSPTHFRILRKAETSAVPVPERGGRCSEKVAVRWSAID